MFNLNALPAHYVSVYGRDKVAEVTGQTSAIVAMWEKREKFPLDAVSKLLEFDPAPLSAVAPLYSNPEPGKKLVILVPLAGPPEPKMMDSLIRLYDKKEMDYRRVAFNCLPVVRNALAAEFLRGPWEWSFWMDGDSLVPAGDAAWYKREAELPMMADVFAGVHTIYRLLVHQKKIVSICYVGRKKGAPPQFGGGEAARQEIRRGPRDRLTEVPWVGFGGVLIHRSVFEDIIATQGEEITMAPGGIGERFNYQYSFFHPSDIETPGDDIPWCNRATRAGHKIHVDLAVMGAHIGDRAYSYADL